MTEKNQNTMELRQLLNQKLDQAEPLCAVIEKALKELYELPETESERQALIEKRNQAIADCYLSGIEPDTGDIDEAIAAIEAAGQGNESKRNNLWAVLEVLNGRNLALYDDCRGLVSQIIPNTVYGDMDDDIPF